MVLDNHRYEVGRPLGAGGMGAVFAGFDQQLGRQVALKVVLPALRGSAQALRRAAEEAKALARVDHPHVVRLFDVFTHESLLVLVLELVSGGTLADLVEQGLTPPVRATELLVGVLHGLGALHDHGLVHRDVKPTNVLLTPAGMPKITDLGIVRDAERTRFTATGAVLGTVAYMAPEAVLAQPVTPRTDLYAAGLVLFELLACRLPFHGDSEFALLRERTERDVDCSLLPATTPPALVGVVQRALVRDPAHRFASATEMSRALESVLVGARAAESAPAATPEASGSSREPPAPTGTWPSTTLTPAPAPSPAPTPVRRLGAAVRGASLAVGAIGVAVALLAATAAAAGVLYLVWRTQAPSSPRPPPIVASAPAPSACPKGSRRQDDACIPIASDPEPTLPPAVGWLDLDCDPKCHYVGLTGRPLGQTPLHVELPPGEYAIHLNAMQGVKSCRMRTIVVDVVAGRTTTKRVNMRPCDG